MPKLILTFDDRELQDCALGSDPVTIGRLPDNTIVIDNPVVSGRHARVFRDGHEYVIEDLRSTNGTFVNEKPIARHTLLEGDVVLVGRHSLVFTLADGEQAAMARAPDPFVPGRRDKTALDIVPPKTLLEELDHGRPSQMHTVIPKTSIPAPPPRHGSVRVLSSGGNHPEYPLTAVTTLIGKTADAQIRTHGWFKPKVSAAIARKGDGFTVTPMGAHVTVNNQKVLARQDLRAGDIIRVSGLTLEFRLV